MSNIPPPEGSDGGPEDHSSISDEQLAAFLRDAAEGHGTSAPKEPSARARMANRRLRKMLKAERKGRSPKGRAFRDGAGAVIPWMAVAAVVLVGAWQQGLLSWDRAPASGPAKAVALPGGGTSDGDRCGTRGFHHFPLPAAASSPAPKATPRPGPQLELGSYGYAQPDHDAASFHIGLLFAQGPKGSLTVSRTLGGEGVAVEIEGPNGLVAGAHGLPVTWNSPGKTGREDKTRIDLTGGGSGEIRLPARALCPGYDADAVWKGLQPPVNSSNTITGQPIYTLTVSVRDPGIGELRKSIGVPVGGNLLSTNNLVPDGP
ncbi:hypothetical protein [Streptomyces sp. NPDC001816]|uniref:hypothetical protein n=1 Tax=Streptomyces sp. NPDC001816 TaxID=3364612 RepID=UPI0036A8BC86